MGTIIQKLDAAKPRVLFFFQCNKYVHHIIGINRDNEHKHFEIINNKIWCMFNQVRGKKNRKKRERINLTEEQKSTKLKVPPIRLEDRTTVCEPPSVISKNIKKEIMKLCVGKEKTRRHFSFRNKYRIKKLLSITHDKENIKHKKNPSTFITPLTKLQHESTLPRSLDHDRFNFPHTFHYSVIWHGSSIVDHDENNICFFSSNINDLSLSSREKKKITQVLGEERVDKKKQIIYLESNFFNTYNHNAAYLGDAIQLLMKRIKSL
ncbi:ribosomal protein S35 [Plasmodium brasilianum]|uniref:Mitochondrial ribosomal protein S35, putative n=2 Tax=Plasmodium (Plasmodium) TaxID=418103 RepID=A0A1A8WDW3_PLAMA|nr:mitochondrial ribosomal protein S35 precursor, putative [Plasmodium malariae]KAI4834691.1 ribosomal protein S35 [Plasmodium brasilianum]SBS90208.1 mitochondrial ribosomal protein S35 precursor, putative [Plasmodium malariae]SCP03236.1 mitochondrial ribosomal protein S35 precursor, putative [Plasmodium malariae]